MSAQELLVYGSVPDAVRAAVAEGTWKLRNLRQILTWAATHAAAGKPEHVVAQDEYTHDVVMRFDDGVYVVFDVT